MDDRLYRPAATVRLLIRLEDFEPPKTDPEIQTEAGVFEQQVVNLKTIEADRLNKFAQAAGALSNPSTRNGAGRDLSNARRELNAVQRQIAQLQDRDPKARGIPSQAGDLFSVEVETSPIDVSVELNTYRSADTCNVTIPFRDAPLESQLIRSCLIEVFLGTVKAEDFATPGRWKLPLDRSNIMFRGFVDEWKTSHKEDDAVVTIAARSLESILIDSKINPLNPVFRVRSGGEKISAYVTRILAEVPATSGRKGGDQLKAVYFDADDEPTIGAEAFSRVLQTVKSRVKAAGSNVVADVTTGGTDTGGVLGTGEPRMGPAVPEDMTAWDLIVQTCFFAGGCVPQYDPSSQTRDKLKELLGSAYTGDVEQGDFILIRPAHTIFSNVSQGISVQGGNTDGFDRRLPNPDSSGAQDVRSDIRFVVWGRNVKSFETNRKLGRVTVPGVEVYGYNPDATPNKRLLVARHPDVKKRATKIGAKGDGKTEQFIRKIVRGIRSQKLLDQIAVSLYSAIGRNELSVSIETDDMASYINPDPNDPTRHNENPDVLRIRHGTPVRVLVARKVVDATGNNITLTPLADVFERRDSELRRFFLDQSQRFRPDLDPGLRKAEVDLMVSRIVLAINRAGRDDVFYTRSIRHTWSADEGWAAFMELVNFVEARNLPENISEDAAKADNSARRKAASKTKTIKLPDRQEVEVPNPPLKIGF